MDYRQLNQMTIKDAYPIPRIDEIFTSLHNAFCFVALDLLKGYHQIPVREEDRPKTAFITDKGLCVYCNEVWPLQSAAKVPTIDGRHFP